MKAHFDIAIYRILLSHHIIAAWSLDIQTTFQDTKTATNYSLQISWYTYSWAPDIDTINICKWTNLFWFWWSHYFKHVTAAPAFALVLYFAQLEEHIFKSVTHVCF